MAEFVAFLFALSYVRVPRLVTLECVNGREMRSIVNNLENTIPDTAYSDPKHFA